MKSREWLMKMSHPNPWRIWNVSNSSSGPGTVQLQLVRRYQWRYQFFWKPILSQFQGSFKPIQWTRWWIMAWKWNKSIDYELVWNSWLKKWDNSCRQECRVHQIWCRLPTHWSISMEFWWFGPIGHSVNELVIEIVRWILRVWIAVDIRCWSFTSAWNSTSIVICSSGKASAKEFQLLNCWLVP